MVLREMSQPTEQTAWRATGVYLPTNASKTGLLEETRLFLLALDEQRTPRAASQLLVNGALPQRSRETRQTIVTVIQQRLTRWSPPAWVCEDLVSHAQDSNPASLQAVLLLHVVRQDALLYDFVQHDLVPRWERGDDILVRADVQRFLDHAVRDHPEVDTWSRETREKLSGNMLSILRDYGLLRGREQKQIIEPLVPLPVAAHIVHLLRDEGVAAASLADHADWRIWLWDSHRVHQTLAALAAQEANL